MRAAFQMSSEGASIENLVGVHICFLLSLMYLNTQGATCLCFNIDVCLIHGSIADWASIINNCLNLL